MSKHPSLSPPDTRKYVRCERTCPICGDSFGEEVLEGEAIPQATLCEHCEYVRNFKLPGIHNRP